MREVHYSERFDTQAAITRPWALPGGKNFLIRVLLWGAALMLFNYFFFGRGILTAYMDLFREMAALQSAGEAASEEDALTTLSSVGALYKSLFFVSIFVWLISVSVETAMHKNIFRGEDNGLFPLRFGRDEARVLLTQLMVFLSAIGLYITGFILLAVTISLAVISGGIGALFILLGFLGFIAMIVLIVMVFTRLGPAAAYGVKHDRLYIFEMWEKTKGYGWNIFGSYLVVCVCGYIILTIIMSLGLSAIFGDMAATGLLMGSVPEDPDALFKSIAETFNKPSVKISLGVFMILYVAAQLFWSMHIWGVGNYTAAYIDEQAAE